MRTYFVEPVANGTVVKLKDYLRLVANQTGIKFVFANNDQTLEQLLKHLKSDNGPFARDIKRATAELEQSEAKLMSLKARTAADWMSLASPAGYQIYKFDKSDPKYKRQQRLGAMRQKVIKWSPPADLDNFKALAVEALTDTIGMGRLYLRIYSNRSQYRTNELRFATETVARHQQALDNAIAQRNECIDFIEKLLASLPPDASPSK